MYYTDCIEHSNELAKNFNSVVNYEGLNLRNNLYGHDTEQFRKFAADRLGIHPRRIDMEKFRDLLYKNIQFKFVYTKHPEQYFVDPSAKYSILKYISKKKFYKWLQKNQNRILRNFSVFKAERIREIRYLVEENIAKHNFHIWFIGGSGGFSYTVGRNDTGLYDYIYPAAFVENPSPMIHEIIAKDVSGELVLDTPFELNKLVTAIDGKPTRCRVRNTTFEKHKEKALGMKTRFKGNPENILIREIELTGPDNLFPEERHPG